MMKRLIGVIAALGIVALLVFVVLHRAEYRSMAGWDLSAGAVERVAE